VTLVSFVFNKKKKGAFTPQDQPRGRTAFQFYIKHSGNEEQRQDQDKEHSAQDDGGPEQCALDAAPGGKYTSRVSACQSAQARTLALQDDAQDEQDRDYNQRDI
jgi:hypothetical protein